jgi:hypothetical protein
MDIDEMKAAWKQLDQRTGETLDLSRQLLKQVQLSKVESAMRRTTVPPLVELVIDVLAVVLIGSFLGTHVDSARFALPAAVLQLAAVLKLASTIRQLVLIRSLDYTQPVVVIQRQLSSLKLLRVRTTLVTLLVSPLLWTPLAIVGAQALIGLDLYQGFGVRWIAANLLFGIAVIPVAIWIARRCADRFRNTSFARQIVDDIAGRSLMAATAAADEIAQFESGR